MTSIFRPAIYLMNKFKFSKKFTIIFIVFLIPLCTLITMQIKSAKSIYEIKASQSEGINTNILLRIMIQHMQEHRGLASTYLNANKDFKKDLELKGSELEKDIEALNQALNDNKELANIKDDWNQIQQELDKIQTNLDQMAAKESYDKAISSTDLLKKTIEAEFIEKDQISIESKPYFDLATSSINNVYAFLNEASLFLKDKANQELMKAEFNIKLVSSLGIIAGLIVIYLFVGLYLSIKGTVSKISNVASTVATGNLRTRIELETSDETIEIANALNQGINSFHELSSQGQVMAKNLNESADALQSVTEHTTESDQKIAESMSIIMNQTNNQLQSTTTVSEVMQQVKLKEFQLQLKRFLQVLKK